MSYQNEQRIDEVIATMLRALGLQTGYERIQIQEFWEELVGPMIARHTKSMRLKNRVLFVKLDSALVRQELLMMRSQICDAINTRAKKVLVEEIVLQ